MGLDIASVQECLQSKTRVKIEIFQRSAMWAKKEERKDEKKQLEEVEQEARAIEIERKKIDARQDRVKNWIQKTKEKKVEEGCEEEKKLINELKEQVTEMKKEIVRIQRRIKGDIKRIDKREKKNAEEMRKIRENGIKIVFSKKMRLRS